MAYAFIHGEVKGSGASVEFKGNGLDLLDLTIRIVGSVVAEVPEPLRPYVIKKIQDKIPDAVQNDLEAQGKAAPAEKKEKPPVGETVGFRMARQFAETEPGFKDFIVARVLMAVADDEENLAGLKDSMFEIINEMVKDCWAEKTAKTEAEKEAAVNQLKAFVAMFFEPEN